MTTTKQQLKVGEQNYSLTDKLNSSKQCDSVGIKNGTGKVATEVQGDSEVPTYLTTVVETYPMLPVTNNSL
jgi:hypothetical protein